MRSSNHPAPSTHSEILLKFSGDPVLPPAMLQAACNAAAMINSEQKGENLPDDLDKETLYWDQFWAEVDSILSKIGLNDEPVFHDDNAILPNDGPVFHDADAILPVDKTETKEADPKPRVNEKPPLNPDLIYSDEDYIARLLSTLQYLNGYPDASKTTNQYLNGDPDASKKVSGWLEILFVKEVYDTFMALTDRMKVAGKYDFKKLQEKLEEFSQKAKDKVAAQALSAKGFDLTRNIRSTLEDCVEQVEKAQQQGRPK